MFDSVDESVCESDDARAREGAGAGLVVLDSDTFYDPDDAVTLAIARTVPNLVVVTADESRGRRARMVRRMLDLMDRPEVPVFAGVDLGGEHRFLLDDHLEGTVPQPDDLGVLAEICAATDGAIRWVGMGPMCNIARLLSVAPQLTERIVLTQMGGWLDRYRDKTRASHNFHTDPVSAGLALRVAYQPRLVLSDFTNVSQIEITADWAFLRHLREQGAPEWARLVAANFEAWFTRRPSSRMHDPLTFAAALGLPFITFKTETVRIEQDARLFRDPAGRQISVPETVDYDSFLEWMHEGVRW